MPVSGAASISFPNRAAAEVDFYAGVRPTFGALALDFGAWYYWYPGGQCFNAAQGGDCLTNADPVTLGLPVNGNVIKSNLSFWEVYAKAALTVNEYITIGGAAYYSNSVLNSGADGTFVVGNIKYTAPSNAAAGRPRVLRLGGNRPLVPRTVGQLLLHRRRRSVRQSVPERHSVQELHHLEPRHRLHQERVHA